jgi:tetratricopeptide (TPR) repeat protein
VNDLFTMPPSVVAFRAIQKVGAHAASVPSSAPIPSPSMPHAGASASPMDLGFHFFGVNVGPGGILEGVLGTLAVAAVGFLLRWLWKRFGRQEVRLTPGGVGEPQRPELPFHELARIPTNIDNVNVLDLLDWKTRLARLTGQDELRDTLLTWATSKGEPIQVRLLSGPGGIGKTRLAAEVARAMNSGWRRWLWASSGFIAIAEPRVFEFPALLILDYPESRSDDVRSLLGALSRAPNVKRPLRVLLLSRYGLEYWRPRLEEGTGPHYFIDELCSVRIDRLDPKYAEALFRQITRRLCRHLKITIEGPSDEVLRSWLETPLHTLPLFTTAAAIQSVLEPSPSLTSGEHIIQALAKREIQRLRTSDPRFEGGSVARLAAFAIVRGGFDAEDLLRFADPSLQVGLPPRDRVVDAVANLPWWTNGSWEVGGHDVFAAALVFEVFASRDDKARDDSVPQWLWSALVGKTIDNAERLARLLYDVRTIYGTSGMQRLLGWLEAMVDETKHPGQTAELRPIARYERLPSILAPLAVRILQVEMKAGLGTDEQAANLNAQGFMLAKVGDRIGALRADKEATEMYRRLAEAQPATFEPYLALSLNNVAVDLGRMGDHVGALPAIEEAVAIRRELAKREPAAFEPHLAASLNNLSNVLRGIGDRGGALHAIEDAAEIYRRLAEARPAEYEPDLAMSLNNLSSQLSDTGRRDAALRSIKEGAEIHRRLAEAQPAAYEPDLAASLENLSSRLSEMGDRDGALRAIEEAVEIRHRLAQAQPTAYEPDLAGSLNNLSSRLSEVGDHDRALRTIEEAVEIRRRLAQAEPAAFEPDLAGSLNNLSSRLSEMGDHDGALRSIEEAVAIRRRLAKGQPTAFEPDLAESLHDLSIRLSDVGDRDGALRSIEEAVTIRRQLTKGQAAVFEPDLAKSLNLLNSLRPDASGDGA